MSEKRIGRKRAAEILGTTTAVVREAERAGKLSWQRDDMGRISLVEKEVRALAHARGGVAVRRARDGKPHVYHPKGKLSAQVFEMFAKKHSLVEIVIALRCSPEAVRRLWKDYTISLDQGDALERDAEVLRQLRKEETIERREKNKREYFQIKERHRNELSRVRDLLEAGMSRGLISEADARHALDRVTAHPHALRKAGGLSLPAAQKTEAAPPAAKNLSQKVEETVDASSVIDPFLDALVESIKKGTV